MPKAQNKNYLKQNLIRANRTLHILSRDSLMGGKK